MEKETVIKIENVKKQYRLGTIGGGTLQGDLQSWWARKRGKEDPNLKIGQEQHGSNETFYALNGINFEVYKGERLGIIGGNGAGKSTTLKLLSRVTAPTEGNIYIKGRISSMLEVGTGFHPELTGRENIYLNGAILGMSKSEVDSKMEDIIDFSECRQFIDTPVKRYSSGMYVKLAFAVAAHLDSEILVMDEVLAVGDMKFQQKCLNKMSDVAKNEGRTVLYVSHNMNTIRQLCDRCIVLEKGRVIFNGDVEDAINIYMNTDGEMKLFNDCENIPREAIGDHTMHIQSIELLNLIEPVLIDNSTLDLKIKCFSKNSYNNVAFRIILFSSDHIAIGMAASLPCININKGENVVNINVSFDNLSQGVYHGRIVFYEVDSYGNEVVHDVVENAFLFRKELRKKLHNTTMVWKKNAWGYISFPLIEVVNEE